MPVVLAIVVLLLVELRAGPRFGTSWFSGREVAAFSRFPHPIADGFTRHDPTEPLRFLRRQGDEDIAVSLDQREISQRDPPIVLVRVAGTAWLRLARLLGSTSGLVDLFSSDMQRVDHRHRVATDLD